MAINKVIYGNTTLMDITDSTVDTDNMLTGTKAYGANGEPVIGGVVESWTGTMAQYLQDASNIPDGTQVNILDDFTMGNDHIAISDIYSTEEQEIGVWTDGRPLYQKVFISSNAFAIGTSWINTGWNVSFANVLVKTRIVDSVGQVFCGVNAGFISGSLGLQAFSTISNAKICILQYTKTADPVGSGKYVPNGDPAIHYSKDEQVVGTWITGKPLYQKSYEITTPSTASTPTAVITYPSTWVIRSIDGLYNDANPINIYRGANYYTATFNNKTNHTIDIELKGISVGVSGHITLRYTKSTD